FPKQQTGVQVKSVPYFRQPKIKGTIALAPWVVSGPERCAGVAVKLGHSGVFVLSMNRWWFHSKVLHIVQCRARGQAQVWALVPYLAEDPHRRGTSKPSRSTGIRR